MRFTPVRAIVVGAASIVLLAGGVSLAAQADDTPKKDDAPSVTTPKDSSGKTFKHNRGMGFGAGTMGFGKSMDPDQLAKQVEQIPEAARKDLADVLLASEGDRAALIQKMIDSAKDGGYGSEIADQIAKMDKFSKSLENGEFKQKMDKAFPQQLRDELAKLKDMDRDARAEAMKKIVEDARAGKYGEDAKKMFPERSNRMKSGHSGKWGKSKSKSDSKAS